MTTNTLKTSESGYSRCDLSTRRAPWGNAGSGVFELPTVWVAEPAGQVDTACALATRMAAIVWPKLPPM